MKVKDHSVKFKRWQHKVCAQTGLLSGLVELRVVEFFQRLGFERVDVALNNSEWPVAMDSIELERATASHTDSIYLSFAKHGVPRFQLGCSRREKIAPYNFIRSACLVRKPNQYYCWWGKPWWFPLWLWQHEHSKQLIDKIMPTLPQILDFLDTGQRGKNISKEV